MFDTVLMAISCLLVEVNVCTETLTLVLNFQYPELFVLQSFVTLRLIACIHSPKLRFVSSLCFRLVLFLWTKLFAYFTGNTFMKSSDYFGESYTQIFIYTHRKSNQFKERENNVKVPYEGGSINNESWSFSRFLNKFGKSCCYVH